jgi:hypothetical protein
MLEDLNTVVALKKEIEQLRAGEEGGFTPEADSTPGQLLKRIHELGPEKRLKLLNSLLQAAREGSRCTMEHHDGELADMASGMQVLSERARAWQTAHRLLTIWAGALAKNRGAVLTSEHVADKLTTFLSRGTPETDFKCRRILCGHEWTEAGRTFQCAEPVGPDGGHQGEHFAYVREGSAKDEELRMKHLEQENFEMRRRLGLPLNVPGRRHS